MADEVGYARRSENAVKEERWPAAPRSFQEPSSSDCLISYGMPTASSSSSHSPERRSSWDRVQLSAWIPSKRKSDRCSSSIHPDLALNAAGVVVRARRRQGEEANTVVKLRPVVPAELPEELRLFQDVQRRGGCDAGWFRVLCFVEGEAADNGQMREVAGGERSIRKLFSKAQRGFYATHAPDGLELDQLAVLGPIPTLKLKIKPKGFGRRLVGELWLYPDRSRSSSCPRRPSHPKRSMSPPKRERSSAASVSTSRGSSRRRRRPRWSSSRRRMQVS